MKTLDFLGRWLPCLALFFAVSGKASFDDLLLDDFEIQGVEVDVTAASASEARLKAFDTAQTQAFQKLVDRVVPESERSAWLALKPSRIEALVQDIEVTKEKNSAVRYIATFTVRFKDIAVKDLLTQHLQSGDLPRAKTQEEDPDALEKAPLLPAKKTLVLPLYLLHGTPILWEENNTWFAFVANGSRDDLLVIPAGDLEDVADISPKQLLAQDTASFAKLMDRYGVAQLVVAALKEEKVGEPRLALSLYNKEGSVLARQEKPLLPQIDSARSFKPALQMIEGFVKEPSSSSAASDQEEGPSPVMGAGVDVVATFDTLKEWHEIKKRLEHMPLLKLVLVKQLARYNATLRVRPTNKQDDVKRLLEQEGFQVSRGRLGKSLEISLKTPETSAAPLEGPSQGEVDELSQLD
ncbi:MAG: DUF2066 domain-containing protein [Alphaproteobacteria bacterium]|jgi:sulfur relay (sulfurtransferase) DsrF/TusC family protein|nr:DUF2066 domain-containing protein [Alphaproteobacteria bacterium]